VAPLAGPATIDGVNKAWLNIIRGPGCDEVAMYSGIPSGTISVSSPDWVQRAAARGYRATVAYVDKLIGKVLDALVQAKMNENTHIVLLGDHGFHLGDKVRPSPKNVYCTTFI
jgi:membrane-anchored protein YejM (alkaline phosphatase superfamily)